MKKLIPILLIIAILTSGCDGMNVFNNLLGERNGKQTKASELVPDVKDAADGALSREDDREDMLNTLSMEEDIKFTQDAKEYNITEYEILFDSMEITSESVVPTEITGVTGFEILEKYFTVIPGKLEQNFIYDRYDVAFDYVLAMSDNINIRSKPSLNSAIVAKAHSFEKLNVIAKVKGQYLDSFGDNIWYEIMWKEGSEQKKGYIFGKLAETRTFRFDEMISAVEEVKTEVDGKLTAYIANYKDRNGKAPLYKGSNTDAFGKGAYQSAPAYTGASTDSDFRYLPDGTLIILLEKTEKFYKVNVPGIGDEYYVPIQYVSGLNPINKLYQVVVIDAANQNEAVFQYYKNKWQLVSVTYVSTCSQDMLLEEGKPAVFKVIDKKEKLEFLNSDGDDAAGYAPYALRFSGSSHIYGVPVEYEIKDGVVSDPGTTEYIYTLGTLPRTKWGIRNYTSHAKFLYDWLLESESAVIVLP